tara:strand:- start:846 stop:1727 length:882 start_codon:yes stop_codon:yes gene_type:complete
MSYYDRLNKVIGEQEGGSASVQNAIAMAKERSQDAFSQTQAQAASIMPKEINKFAEEFGIKQASKMVLTGIGKKFVVPRIKAQRANLDDEIALKKGDVAFDKGVSKDIQDKAAERVAQPADNEPAYKIGEGDNTEYAGESMRPTGGLRRDNTGGEEMEGKVIPKGTKAGDDVQPFDETTGMTEAETTRVAAIKTSTETAGEDIAEMGAKTLGEAAIDAIPVVGEIAMLGAMFGGMIHTGHAAHKAQLADDATEQTDLQNSQAAQMYSGFNRPNFGSMALPSFDTSKNPAMLQE